MGDNVGYDDGPSRTPVISLFCATAITAEGYFSFEITWRLQRALASVQRYKMEIFDHSGVRLRLKVRLMKAEVVETLLFGCMTCNPNKPDYDRLKRVHHSILLRCLGWRKRKRDDHTLSYADVLAKTASQSREAIARKQRILSAGFVARMWEEGLPQRVMFGELRATQGVKRMTQWLI